MKPGRELDALVAEKVMGWTWTYVAFVWDASPRSYLIPPGGLREVSDTTSGSWSDGILYDMPAYSTDISAAWEVVEHVGPFFELRNASIWWCRIDSAEAFADTAPYAICLAALTAVGEDV